MATNFSDVATFAQIKIDNNKLGVVSVLNKAGYNLKYDASSQDILALAMDYYRKDPQGFFSSMSQVRYRSDAGNYTTSPEFQQRLHEYVAQRIPSAANQKTDLAILLQQLGGILSGTSTTTTNTSTTTTTPAESSNWGLIAGLIIISLVVVGLGIYALKKFV